MFGRIGSLTRTDFEFSSGPMKHDAKVRVTWVVHQPLQAEVLDRYRQIDVAVLRQSS